MQSLNKKFDDYSDIDFLDWEDDITIENVQFSDVENVVGSKKLIKSLQSTGNRVRNRASVSLLCQNKRLPHGNTTELSCKKIKLSKFDALNVSYVHIPTKVNRQIDLLSHDKNTSNVTKQPDDYSHPGMSKSQSDSMTISSQEASGNQIASVSSQNSSGSKMVTSSQEIPTSQKMITSSQEISTSRKIITSSQEMILSSQENPASQNITSSQESCNSPKRIASSQESLGNQVMNISIKEDSSIMKTTSQSRSRTQIDITPCPKNSNFQQIFATEYVKNSKPTIFNEETINSKKLMECNQQNLGNVVSSNITEIFHILDSPEENKHLISSASDSFCNKTRRYNKTEKRIIWSLRKRELIVTRRENAIEIREKQLKAREADILKREDILNARERKYLRCKTNMKKWIQKLKNNSRKTRKRVGVLEDETNAFNKLPAFKVFK